MISSIEKIAIGKLLMFSEFSRNAVILMCLFYMELFPLNISCTLPAAAAANSFLGGRETPNSYKLLNYYMENMNNILNISNNACGKQYYNLNFNGCRKSA